MSDKEKKDDTHVPDYGSSSGYGQSAPQSGMVQDEKKSKDDPKRPPTGGGIENYSNPTSTDTGTTSENPNANK